jgi:hypothetical protein
MATFSCALAQQAIQQGVVDHPSREDGCAVAFVREAQTAQRRVNSPSVDRLAEQLAETKLRRTSSRQRTRRCADGRSASFPARLAGPGACGWPIRPQRG